MLAAATLLAIGAASGTSESVTIDPKTGAVKNTAVKFNNGQEFLNGIAIDVTLAAKALDSAVVHNTGTETVNGAKTFGTLPTFPTQAANLIFAGPSSGGAVAPTFRALVAADLGVGSITQAWDADLDALAALSGTNTIY